MVALIAKADVVAVTSVEARQSRMTWSTSAGVRSGVRSSSCTAASARIWSRLGRFTVMGDADFLAGVGRRVGAGSARDEACGGRVGSIVPKSRSTWARDGDEPGYYRSPNRG